MGRPLQHPSHVCRAVRSGVSEDVLLLDPSSYHGPKRQARTPAAARRAMQNRHPIFFAQPMIVMKCYVDCALCFFLSSAFGCCIQGVERMSVFVSEVSVKAAHSFACASLVLIIILQQDIQA